MRIPKRIIELPLGGELHRDDVLAIVDQNNRTSKITLLQLAEFLSGSTQTLYGNDNFITEGIYNDLDKEIVLSRNDGAQIRITGFTGGSDLYTNHNPVPQEVGGVTVGTTFSGKTMEEVFNMLFYPTIEPEFIIHETELEINSSVYREIGEIIDLTFISTAAGGEWTQSWVGPNLQPSKYAGNVNEAKIKYTGGGSFSDFNSLLITPGYDIETVGFNNYEVVSGTQTWKLTTSFLPGGDPIDSTGGVSQTLNPFSGGDKVSSKSIIGVYPIYVMESDGILHKQTPLISHDTSFIEIDCNYSMTNFPNVPFKFIVPQDFGTIIDIRQKDPFGDWGPTNLLTSNWDINSITYDTDYSNNVPYWEVNWDSSAVGFPEFKIIFS